MKAASTVTMRACVSGAALAILWTISAPLHAADVKKGGEIYQRHCENCHGASGRGDFPGMPDFSRGEGLFRSNASLAETIRAGKVAMPAFEGVLTDDEIFDVIAYLRTLR